MRDKYWYLKHCDLFARVSAEDVAQLEARCRLRTFTRGGVIYLPSDNSDAVLLLVSGRIKLYHITAEGKQAVLAFIDPGELFGELALIGDAPREEFAEAMEPSTLVLIPCDEIERLVERHPDVSLRVTKLFGLRMRRVERRLKSLLYRSNRDRLVHLLLELAEKYGQRTAEGVRIGIRLSHQDLASIIGATRETVTVLLGELQAEGNLLIRRRQVVLRDLHRLAAGIDAPVPLLASEAPHRVAAAVPERVGTRL